MSLQNVPVKKEYRSLIDNIAKEFYVPLLKKAVLYRRSVGFFSSSVLVKISKGIIELVKHGGKIQLVATPDLSDEDIEAIRHGYSRRNEVIKNAVINSMTAPETEYQAERLNLLANLVADGYMDIKIAVLDNGKEVGMYHEKLGIIEDSDRNKVAFSGSMNETLTAVSINYESIDVFTSWSSDEERILLKENAFLSIWNDIEPGIKVQKFQEVTDAFIKKYRHSDIDYTIYPSDEDNQMQENVCSFFALPNDVILYDYQKKAINNWIKCSFCGVYDMATGAGKTFTALGSLSALSQYLNENIAVIIAVPYQHLVEQWVEDINKFNVQPIIAYSYPKQNWRNEFRDAVNAYNTEVIKHFCIITTNATFALDDFQEILARMRKNYCFVVDEAHNFGALRLSKLLPKKAKYRLALSATLTRHGDEEGTQVLLDYFGKEPCILFTLKEAIQNGFLTSYYYYPVITYLSKEELEEYQELTKKIKRIGGTSKENHEKNSVIDLLLIKRARIIAGCHQKVDKLLEIIKQYKNENHILVYCGATTYDSEELSSGDDIRQIDEVNYRLYHELSMKVRKFTSSENREERQEIRQMFADGEMLQVITAIKCLDEGVNIPAIQKAFILASSTNPKEYIQRRGRVLRKFPGKEYAEIFDFITLPRPLEEVRFCSPEELQYDLSLINKEFTRMLDFAETARNPAEIDDLRDKILELYRDSMSNGGSIYD